MGALFTEEDLSAMRTSPMVDCINWFSEARFHGLQGILRGSSVGNSKNELVYTSRKWWPQLTYQEHEQENEYIDSKFVVLELQADLDADKSHKRN